MQSLRNAREPIQNDVEVAVSLPSWCRPACCSTPAPTGRARHRGVNMVQKHCRRDGNDESTTSQWCRSCRTSVSSKNRIFQLSKPSSERPIARFDMVPARCARRGRAGGRAGNRAGEGGGGGGGGQAIAGTPAPVTADQRSRRGKKKKKKKKKKTGAAIFIRFMHSLTKRKPPLLG